MPGRTETGSTMGDSFMKQLFKDNLVWLDHWFTYQAKHCQYFNISIETLDNPGWGFFVELIGTKLEKKSFVTIKFTEEKDNWLMCRVQEKRFEGACGPRNLPQVLGIFRKWIEEDLKHEEKDFEPSIKEDHFDDFLWLQNWYCYYCDGDWEHCYGIKIWTTEEPFGWRVSIDLEMSELEGCFFEEINSHGIDEKDFVHCEVQNNKFEGTCGPKNLTQVVSFFRNWAEGLGQKVDTERTRFHECF